MCFGGFLYVLAVVLLHLSAISLCGACLFRTYDAVRFVILVASLSAILTRLFMGARWARLCFAVCGCISIWVSLLAFWYLLCAEEYTCDGFLGAIGFIALLLGVALLCVPKVNIRIIEKRYTAKFGWVACPLACWGLLISCGFCSAPVVIVDSVSKFITTIVLSVFSALTVLLALNRVEKI